MEDIILKLKSVTFGYQEEESLLEKVDIEVRKGEYVGIIGQNGSAKSTLLKLMVGILKPRSGEVYLKRSKIEDFKDWGSIGYLSQQVRSFNSNFPATVEEVVGANLYSKKGILKILNKYDREKIREALRCVGMENYENKIIGSLSGGQQQRVFIARLLVSKPDIIFMDEPLVGMDMESQEHFYEILEELNEKMGITLIMVTHDIRAAFERVDRVLLLGDKKIIGYNLSDCETEEQRLEIARREVKSLV
jgi:zinc transport system ATP-binding protein